VWSNLVLMDSDDMDVFASVNIVDVVADMGCA
jgi:hypothetical protein